MKETHYKLRHRVTALFAAAVMLCSMLPGAAFAEEPTPQPTEETVQMEQQTEPSETDNGQTDESSPDPGEDVTEATPETAEEQPAEEEIPAAVVGAELYTDYNADVAAADKGGTKLVTSTGVETTVTIYDTSKDPRRTYNTDNSGKAANEDSYTITPTDGVMKNDRTLGEISISKVDLDAVRYVGGSTAHGTALASGQAHGDAALDGAVYDLYAAEDITHPDGVTGVVDYSKIVDTDGNPIWHTTIRDNSGQWVSDYLPVLKKDHLVASAKIENGWLCFSNLYLGKYYVVERSTGVVIPLRDGALAVSGTYPTVDSRIKAATGQTAAFAKNGSGQYTDWVYKNKFSTVSKGKALDGSWTYDAYYLSFAGGYLCDEHNYYITPAYSDEGWYVEKTTFADNRQAAGEQIDKTSYSANYHIHADNALAESQDQVAKGNVEISKIVSSSGQSNGLELEGAGFTFFLVSDLSKAEQFEQTRSGSYTLQSILDDVTFAWDNELNDVVMATSIAKVDGAASSQSFEVVRSKDSQGHYGRPKKRPNPPSIRRQLADAREESFGY